MHAAKYVVMLGAALEAPGGMTSVALTYRDAGLFARWNVRYLATFVRPGLLQQLRVFPLALLTLLAWLMRGQVTLVHANTASRGSFLRKSLCCALAWCFRVPYVFHVHSGEFPQFFWHEAPAPLRWWVCWTLRNAACVVALTPSWQAELRRMEPAAVVRVVVNPVTLTGPPAAVRPEVRRVLFLGRLRAKKGVYDLVRALPAVLSVVPGLVLTIAGDEDLDGVQRLASDLGVAHAVELPGWLDAPAKAQALAQADILVLPSYFEALPVCILEAMALGVPVIASRVGGIPFQLDDGRCGVLIEAGDVAGLSGAILTLATDAGARDALARAALERVYGVFAPDKVLGEIDTLWQVASTTSSRRASTAANRNP